MIQLTSKFSSSELQYLKMRAARNIDRCGVVNISIVQYQDLQRGRALSRVVCQQALQVIRPEGGDPGKDKNL